MAQAAGKAYRIIRDNIVAGSFAPGTRLKEELLASLGKVSRTPIREALRRLSAEGLIEFHTNRGAYVTSWEQRDIDEIFHLRTLLEGYAAQLAARHITPRQLTLLRSLQTRVDAAAQGSEPDRLNVIAIENSRFHKLIAEASRNRRLLALLSSIIEMPLMLGTFKRYNEQDLSRSMAHHREMIAAFEVRDSEWARSVMAYHLLAARNVLARPATIPELADNRNRRRGK